MSHGALGLLGYRRTTMPPSRRSQLLVLVCLVLGACVLYLARRAHRIGRFDDVLMDGDLRRADRAVLVTDAKMVADLPSPVVSVFPSGEFYCLAVIVPDPEELELSVPIATSVTVTQNGTSVAVGSVTIKPETSYLSDVYCVTTVTEETFEDIDGSHAVSVTLTSDLELALSSGFVEILAVNRTWNGLPTRSTAPIGFLRR